MDLATLPAWQTLAAYRDHLAGRSLRDMFAADPLRFTRLTRSADGLLLDFSKQRVDATALALLGELATACDVRAWQRRMYAGELINTSERRAALHVALRAAADDHFAVNGRDVVKDVIDTRARLGRFAEAVRSGSHRGFSGAPIRHVVNLGIGGSDLGPRMVVEALQARAHPSLSVHFVSNLDGADLVPVLERLDPRATLFIVASKSFLTAETLRNAQAARLWLVEAAGDQRDAAVAAQFVGVTANARAALEFGIHPERLFAFDDWVGGRYSLWSAIGLPIALAIGPEGFEDLLAGARAMDRHFADAPPLDNLPMLMALIGIWNINFLGAGNLSVSPYSQSLHYLPNYLQQLEMESNGKQVGRDGAPLQHATAPIIWGDAGTNTQHAYFQLLHQGGRLIPSDFIVVAEADYPLPGHHPQLLANCLAQSAALAFGRDVPGDPQRRCPGNQPSTTIALPRLDPFHLGQLIALYEHKTFVQGVIWGVNSFDQWGVELGKQLASRFLPLLNGEPPGPEVDPSTQGLSNWLRAGYRSGGGGA